MKLVIVNEVLPDKDAQRFLWLAQTLVPACEKEWGKMFDTYELQTFLDPTKPYVLKADEMPVFLTERGVSIGAAGHHNVETCADGTKIPTAYISLKNSRSIYGKFHYPLIVLAHKVGTLLIPQRIFGKFAIWAQGMTAVFLHEIYEILGDPFLNRGSGHFLNTTLDSKGRSWLIENADHDRTLKSIKVSGQDCTIPNFVHPNFYKLGATTDLDEFGAVEAPFTLGKNGYANELKADGTYAKILS